MLGGFLGGALAVVGGALAVVGGGELVVSGDGELVVSGGGELVVSGPVVVPPIVVPPVVCSFCAWAGAVGFIPSSKASRSMKPLASTRAASTTILHNMRRILEHSSAPRPPRHRTGAGAETRGGQRTGARPAAISPERENYEGA
jgi:hypothetical protein